MSIKQGSNYIAGGGGKANIDNKSITKNASDELQTIGVINQNDTTTAIKTWTGTKAQYEAIASKDPNTLYNIIDDTDVTLTLLEALYPVGSVYITTAASCPLSTLISGSTWTLVSSGRVLQGASSGHAAGSTVEAGLPNITGSFGIRKSGTSSNTIFDKRGALSGTATTTDTSTPISTSGTTVKSQPIGFDASLSNSIYGNSDTVQPPAYVVNIYRRTN